MTPTHIIATTGGLKLMRLGGLKVGRTPAWFRRIVDRDFGGGFAARWFDHPAQCGDALVSEPYSIDHEAILELIEFANRYDLDVSISGLTHHFPTRTVSIFISSRHNLRQVACGMAA